MENLIYHDGKNFRVEQERVGDKRILIKNLVNSQFAILSGKDAQEFNTHMESTFDEGNISIIEQEIADSYFNRFLVKDLMKCDGCGWIGGANDAEVAHDISLRHDMGAIYSDLECPNEECGSLVYPVSKSKSYPFQPFVTIGDLSSVASLEDMDDLQAALRTYSIDNDVWAVAEEGSIQAAHLNAVHNYMDLAADLIERLRSTLAGENPTSNASQPDCQKTLKENSTGEQSESVLIEHMLNLLDVDDGPIITDGWKNPWVGEAQAALEKVTGEPVQRHPSQE